MEIEVLLALILKAVDGKLAQLPTASGRGPRGFRGAPGEPGERGKDFVLAEHADQIRAWSKEFAVKFSDLSPDEVESLRGPRGEAGAAGVSFNFEAHSDSIFSLVREAVGEVRSDLKLKFEDLSPVEVESLRGPAGRAGRDGVNFNLEAHRDSISEILHEAVKENVPNLKLKFEDLTPDDRESLRGVPGAPGNDGKDFEFEEHRAYFESLAPTFDDLSPDQIENLRGPRGQRGKPGKDFNFEENREFFESLKPKFSDFSDAERQELKLKFSDLNAEERDALTLKFQNLTEEERASLKGPRGQRGRQGESIKGEDGNVWKTGVGAPTIEAKAGDMYLDVASGDIYQWE